MPQEIVISPGEAPKRLENFLKKRFNIGYVRRLFRKNGVRLNGRRAAPEDTAGPGDRIQLYIPYEKTKANSAADPKPSFDIVFEDSDLLILNKPLDVVEVCQLALALTQKWQLADEARIRMAELVQSRADVAASHPNAPRLRAPQW